MYLQLLFVSGYQDSNLGPPAPKAGALTGLRYTPKAFLEKRCKGKTNFSYVQAFSHFFSKKLMPTNNPHLIFINFCLHFFYKRGCRNSWQHHFIKSIEYLI